MTIAKWGTARGGLTALVGCALFASSGCSKQNHEGATTAPVSAPVASALAPASGSVASPKLPAGATACGELGCLQFDSPEDAFRYVLDSKPAVLAVGEAHAQKGSEGVASSAKRFTDAFLPFLSGKASDLVVELMAPNPTCKKKAAEVRKKHEKVTEQHASTNQNEYVQMGERAKKLGIVPDLLRPSCDDLAAINKAGDRAIAVTLETIARLTTSQVGKLLDPGGRKPDEVNKMIVTYGGVLHNDLEPDETKSAWSFGPALHERVKGRYVALDLFVPEYIEDTEVWRALPWFTHYDKAKLGAKTTLFRLGDKSFVLIFPMTEP